MTNTPDDIAREFGHLYDTYIEKYSTGQIGPITFQAFLVREGVSPDDAKRLADHFRPDQSKRDAS